MMDMSPNLAVRRGGIEVREAKPFAVIRKEAAADFRRWRLGFAKHDFRPDRLFCAACQLEQPLVLPMLDRRGAPTLLGNARDRPPSTLIAVWRPFPQRSRSGDRAHRFIRGSGGFPTPGRFRYVLLPACNRGRRSI